MRGNLSHAARGALLAACCGLLACGQNYSDGSAEQALAERDLQAPAATPPANPHAGMLPAAAEGSAAWGDVTLDVPDGWEAVPPSSSMRVAEYRIAAAHGGAEDANLAVFAGNMGTVEDNVRRWLGQFEGGDGSRREARTAGGFAVTFVDASGTYDAGMGMGGGGPKADYRMLGAIVDSGSGFYYLKLTGPGVEVTPLEAAFEAMTLSLRRP